MGDERDAPDERERDDWAAWDAAEARAAADVAQQPPAPTPVADEPDWRLLWGHLLRTARQVAGLTLHDVSTTTGLSKGYLSKLESGHANAANPSRATLAALARALPSFGSLAQTLEPAAPLRSLTFAEPVPTVPTAVAAGVGDVVEAGEPLLRLGWRELEVVVVLLALDRAALVQPLTATLIARALGRPVLEVAPVLADLTRLGVVRLRPPTRPGGAPSFQPAVDFGARIGLTRVGDALVLAAALMAQSSVQVPRRPRVARDPSARPRRVSDAPARDDEDDDND